MRALVTGAAGQDGTILCTLLRREGADVTALVKPGTSTDHLLRYAPGTTVVEQDLADTKGLRSTVTDAGPHEVYNLGGFTAPGESWSHEDEVRVVNVDAVAAILEAVETLPDCRMFQASSASIFEGVDRAPQTERMEREPKSPYAVSKRDAMDLVDAARDRGAHAVAGILYNHESPLRGETFVTRKISLAVANIFKGHQTEVWMGNLDAIRDWGYAPEYTDGMWRMLQADEPEDFVLATGTAYTIRDFLQLCFEHVGLEWEDYVKFDPKFLRPTEVDELIGDAGKAKRKLGWEAKVLPPELAKIMVDADIARLEGAPEGQF